MKTILIAYTFEGDIKRGYEVTHAGKEDIEAWVELQTGEKYGFAVTNTPNPVLKNLRDVKSIPLVNYLQGECLELPKQKQGVNDGR